MAQIRNIEDLALEEITEEFLLEQAIAMGDALGVDTNQGSIYRDACDGHATRTSDFFDDLRQVAEIISLNTCTGEILDERLMEHAMKRNPPEDTSAIYNVTFTGASPEIGDLVSCEGHYFDVAKSGSNWLLVSHEKGTDMNGLVPGLAVIPEHDVDNMISATLGSLATAAVDTESDESARTRLLAKLGRHAGYGNAADFKEWCEAVSGIGRARIVTTRRSQGIVDAYVIAPNGGPVSDTAMTLLQQTIDPGQQGLGEGLAPIGCTFVPHRIGEVLLSLSARLTLEEGASLSTVSDAIISTLVEYLKGLAFGAEGAVTVYYTTIASLVLATDGVLDYSNLLVNNDTANISIGALYAPMVGDTHFIAAGGSGVYDEETGEITEPGDSEIITGHSSAYAQP